MLVVGIVNVPAHRLHSSGQCHDSTRHRCTHTGAQAGAHSAGSSGVDVPYCGAGNHVLYDDAMGVPWTMGSQEQGWCKTPLGMAAMVVLYTVATLGVLLHDAYSSGWASV